MKKITFIIIILTLHNLYSQNMDYKIEYNYTYLKDTLDSKSNENEKMVLFKNDSISFYESNDEYLRDSISQAINFTTTQESVNLFVKLTSSLPQAKVKHQILRNSLEQKHNYFYSIFTDSYVIENNLEKLNWKLLAQDTILENYKCKKATLQYKGRNYIAWYTEEIPLSEGPYKFHGLPGLIIKIDDEKRHHRFQLVGFKKINYKVPTLYNYDKKDYTKANNLKELKKLEDDFQNNLYERITNGSSGMAITINDDEEFRKRMNKKLEAYRKLNNPIELSEYK